MVPFGNQDELATAMRYLLEHPEEVEEMGVRARRLYEERYSFEAQCCKLVEAYKVIAPEIFRTADF